MFMMIAQLRLKFYVICKLNNETRGTSTWRTREGSFKLCTFDFDFTDGSLDEFWQSPSMERWVDIQAEKLRKLDYVIMRL